MLQSRNSTIYLFCCIALFALSSRTDAYISTSRRCSKSYTNQNIYSTSSRLRLTSQKRLISSTSSQNNAITLHMTASAAVGTTTAAAAATTVAIAGAISGGLLGGALHAIAGPDHLAALLPRCVGQRWYRAGRIGALWAMGHSFSATFLGLSAFFLKNRIQHLTRLHFLHGATELAVGLSLILIGILGIKEAREWEEDMTNNNNTMGQPQSLSSAASEVGAKTESQKRAVLLNGILHGFSWDGAPSLAPAVALATLKGSLSFLFSYAIGTMAAMTLATTVIGETTRRAGEIFHKPDLPQKLSLVSSFLAIGVGLFWCYLALKP